MKFLVFLIAIAFCSNVTFTISKLNSSSRNYTAYVEDLDTKSYIDIFNNVNSFSSTFDISTRVKVFWYSMDRMIEPEILLLWFLEQKRLFNDMSVYSISYNQEINNFNYVMNTNRKMADGMLLFNFENDFKNDI